jgi:ketosteroid isomerase-like protein
MAAVCRVVLIASRHAAMYLQARDGHITRIEEYLDSARCSDIRKAREALSGYP